MQVALLVMVGGYAVSALTPLGPFPAAVDEWYNNIAYTLATLLLAVRAAWVRTDRAAWALLAFAVACYTVANAYYLHVLTHLEPIPYPSVADAGWLVIYPCGFLAVGLLLRARMLRFQGSMWLDGLVAALGAAAITTAFVLRAVIADVGGSFATVATNLAYPTFDAVMVALLIGAFAMLGWRPDRAWTVLAGGGAFGPRSADE